MDGWDGRRNRGKEGAREATGAQQERDGTGPIHPYLQVPAGDLHGAVFGEQHVLRLDALVHRLAVAVQVLQPLQHPRRDACQGNLHRWPHGVAGEVPQHQLPQLRGDPRGVHRLQAPMQDPQPFDGALEVPGKEPVGGGGPHGGGPQHRQGRGADGGGGGARGELYWGAPRGVRQEGVGAVPQQAVDHVGLPTLTRQM